MLNTATARIQCRPQISEKTLEALGKMIRLVAEKRGHELQDPIDIVLCRNRDFVPQKGSKDTRFETGQ